MLWRLAWLGAALTSLCPRTLHKILPQSAHVTTQQLASSKSGALCGNCCNVGTQEPFRERGPVRPAGDPKFEYFLDPTQNPAADFFGFLKPNNTFIGTSAGPNVITYAPCFASVAPSGVNVAAIGVNFIPSLLSVFPAGAFRLACEGTVSVINAPCFAACRTFQQQPCCKGAILRLPLPSVAPAGEMTAAAGLSAIHCIQVTGSTSFQGHQRVHMAAR